MSSVLRAGRPTIFRYSSVASAMLNPTKASASGVFFCLPVAEGIPLAARASFASRRPFRAFSSAAIWASIVVIAASKSKISTISLPSPPVLWYKNEGVVRGRVSPSPRPGGGCDHPRGRPVFQRRHHPSPAAGRWGRVRFPVGSDAAGRFEVYLILKRPALPHLVSIADLVCFAGLAMRYSRLDIALTPKHTMPMNKLDTR